MASRLASATTPRGSQTPTAGLLEAATARRQQVPSGPPLSFEEVQEEVESLNRDAMAAVREDRQAEARELLMRAQSLLDRVEEPIDPEELREVRPKLAAAGADAAANLGIHYGKCGDSTQAIRHLQRALKLHRIAGAGLRTLVAAHLNLTACHLEAVAGPGVSLNNHLRHAALQHAQAAVDLCGRLLASPDEASNRNSPEGSEPSRSPKADDCAMLAVAYHKVAEAHEGLHEWGKATHAYAQAYEVVRRGLGPNHQLTRSFERSSRCPGHRVTGGMPMPRGGGSPLTPRSVTTLPCMPRRRPHTSPADNLPSYDLTNEVFAPWPPLEATKEQQLWYAMAKQHRSQLVGHPRSPGGHRSSPMQAMGPEPALSTFMRAPTPHARRVDN